jgi:phage repressor protein C with HTH and peptisase S24 domain
MEDSSMPQANSRSSIPKRKTPSRNSRAYSNKAFQAALPAYMRDKKPITTVEIPANLDPLAYAMGCKGDCLAPLIMDGDTIVCSPSTKPKPGMIVAFSWKGGQQGTVKRLVSELFGVNKGNCQLLITVEMDNPRKQFFFDPTKIDKAHAVIGIVRDGKYISLAVETAAPQGAA